MKKMLTTLTLSMVLLTSNASAGWFDGLVRMVTGGSKTAKVVKKADDVKDKTKDLKGISTTGVVLKTAAATALFNVGLKELEAHPVTPEIIQSMKDGLQSFQTRICIDNDGETYAVNKSFTRCPFGKEEIVNGPIIKFNN